MRFRFYIRACLPLAQSLNPINRSRPGQFVILLRMKTRIAALAQAINSATSAAHEIQLFPAGEFAAVDGRPDDTDNKTWTLTAALAATLVDAVSAAKTPLVIDYEHQTLRAVKNGQPAPAAGWFRSLEWRDGVGLYATGVEWTDAAAAMIAAGEYRYISPVFMYNRRGEVTRLLHAALTNTPAMDGMDAVMLTAASRLASLSTTETQNVDEEFLADLLRQLRWMLNLPETSTPEDIKNELQKLVDYITKNQTSSAAASVSLLDILGALDEQVASLSATQYDPEKHVPIEVVNDMQAQLAAASSESSTAAVEGLVTAALSDGRLLPTQETWARDYGQKNIDGLRSWLEKAPRIAALSQRQTSGVTPRQPNERDALATLTPEQIAICNQFGNDPAEIARLVAED